MASNTISSTIPLKGINCPLPPIIKYLRDTYPANLHTDLDVIKPYLIFNSDEIPVKALKIADVDTPSIPETPSLLKTDLINALIVKTLLSVRFSANKYTPCTERIQLYEEILNGYQFFVKGPLGMINILNGESIGHLLLHMAQYGDEISRAELVLIWKPLTVMMEKLLKVWDDKVLYGRSTPILPQQLMDIKRALLMREILFETSSMPLYYRMVIFFNTVWLIHHFVCTLVYEDCDWEGKVDATPTIEYLLGYRYYMSYNYNKDINVVKVQNRVERHVEASVAAIGSGIISEENRKNTANIFSALGRWKDFRRLLLLNSIVTHITYKEIEDLEKFQSWTMEEKDAFQSILNITLNLREILNPLNKLPIKSIDDVINELKSDDFDIRGEH